MSLWVLHVLNNLVLANQMVSSFMIPYLRNENIPKLCDLVVIWESFLLTFVLAYFEAGKEVLVEVEKGIHPKEEPLQPGLLY